MQMYIALQPLAALIAGILILIMPRLLNYVIAIYLIVIGILGLLKMYMPGQNDPQRAGLPYIETLGEIQLNHYPIPGRLDTG
jgi:hypothetical protein